MDIQKHFLYKVSNKKFLSELLSIKIYELKDIDKYFSTKSYVDKIGQKKRTIFPPKPRYKRILRKINRNLSSIKLPDYINGGVKGKSYVTNANAHIDHKCFLMIDITNFYPSTNERYVYSFFRNAMKMPADIAKIYTLLTTEPLPNHNHRHLPQGYPTSALLSILSYYQMFDKIHQYAKQENITMTVYVDDITFSANKPIGRHFKSKVIRIIESYNFQVNPEKTVHSYNRPINVTGVILKNRTMKVPNKLRKKIIDLDNELEAALLKQDSEHITLLISKLKGCLIAFDYVEGSNPFQSINTKINNL
ncbi:reverse transcriptase family protein [Jeotgalibacillus malaysiensis]|uniref:reverse transcriptase family protein n=1 Tax=Jeotgalibacillus malaysiensis TaxID=1508404 RepID=UPI0038505F3E